MFNDQNVWDAVLEKETIENDNGKNIIFNDNDKNQDTDDNNMILILILQMITAVTLIITSFQQK